MPFSLKAKLNFASSLVLLILATMGWFSFKESRRLVDKGHWVSHGRDVLELSESLRSHFTAAGAARHAYVLSEDPAQSRVFDSESSSTLATLVVLRQAVIDNAIQESRLTELELALRSRLALFKQSVELKNGPINDQVEQEAIAVQGVKLSDHVADQLRQFEDVERDLLQTRVSDAELVEGRAATINNWLGGSVFLFLIVAIFIVNREISRSSRAEIAVGKQRRLLESIVNSCSDVVVVGDEAGRIILRNPAADRLYSNGTAEVLSGDYPQLLGFYKEDGVTPFAPRDLPLARAIRGESVDALELYVRRSDLAEGRYFLAAGGPLIGDRSDHQGGVIFLRDITQRRVDSERLNAALLESERITLEQRELTKLADLFQSCQDVEEACKVVETLSSAIFDSRPGMLFLTNSSRNLVQRSARWGDCSSSKDVFEPTDCWGLRQGKPYAGTEATALLRCSHVVESEAGYLCVPLVAQGETYGILYIEDRAASPESSAETIAIHKGHLQTLAAEAAERISLAVANLKLREVLRHQSIQDPLTGLFNRRYFEQSLDRELQRAIRAHRALSLVMLDIDHFKQFNDSFGHQSGDMLLREVAAAIKSRVRSGDLACRYGGEEFALILAETDTRGAYSCVDKIREAVKRLAVEFRGQSLGSVTISAGIAAFPGHSQNPDELIHMADAALYRAKREGRDRIVLCEEHESASDSLGDPPLHDRANRKSNELAAFLSPSEPRGEA